MTSDQTMQLQALRQALHSTRRPVATLTAPGLPNGQQANPHRLDPGGVPIPPPWDILAIQRNLINLSRYGLGKNDSARRRVLPQYPFGLPHAPTDVELGS